MELEGYSWATCSKQPRLVDCRMGVVNKLDSTANDNDDDGLFTTPSTFRSKSPEFGTKRYRKVLLFLEIPKFPYNAVWDRWKEVSKPNRAWFVQSFR